MTHRPYRATRFTLIELLTVIAIMFVLAGLVLGVVAGVSRAQKDAKTRAAMEKMVLALQEYYQDRGYYPMQAAGDANFTPFTHSQTGRPYLEGYVAGTDYKDAWNRAFQYEYQAGDENFKLWSKGRDPNDSKDDICSWKQN